MDVKIEKEIISKLSVNELETLIKTIDKTEKYCLMLKFTASWCGPCKTIKPICDKYFQNLVIRDNKRESGSDWNNIMKNSVLNWINEEQIMIHY